MIFLIQLIICLAILILWWHIYDKNRFAKYPPGPLRLPIIGNLVQLALQPPDLPSKTFKKLANTYGDIMFLKLGQYETILLNSIDSIKEILSHEKTEDRYQLEIIKDRNDNKNVGLLWSNGKTWQNLRRFTLRNLRDFGFGKSSAMDSVINEEVEKFLQHFDRKVKCAPGNVIRVTDPFTLPMVNGLWRLVSGKTYDLEDSRIQKMIDLNREWVESTSLGNDLSEPFPFLRDWFPNLMGRTLQNAVHKKLYEYMKELLDEQIQLVSDDSEPKTFIDAFYRKIKSSENDPDFNDHQFLMTILDLFLAGSETASNTLNFGILYMILYPEVQEKVQRELDQEIVNGVPIDFSMKERLPYTCAIILEMLRYSSVAPLITPREAMEDFIFRGYHIKKGTPLLANIFGVHHCEKEWGDPRNFRPERFLSTDGTTIDHKVAERLINFGVGKRSCLGQSLAELTLFLYFTSMLRKYKFLKVPGTNPTSEPAPALSLVPTPYEMQVIDRKCFHR